MESVERMIKSSDIQHSHTITNCSQTSRAFEYTLSITGVKDISQKTFLFKIPTAKLDGNVR